TTSDLFCLTLLLLPPSPLSPLLPYTTLFRSICNHALNVKKLECSNCHTKIENDFTLSKFASLSAEQMHFVEVFLNSRGNIKEVEKELGISYPTVRGKLNDIITLLGHDRQSA